MTTGLQWRKKSGRRARYITVLAVLPSHFHAPVFLVSGNIRPAYYNMVTDIVTGCIVRLRHVLRFWHRLTALFLPLTWRFLMLGCQFQLYFAVEGGKLGLQLLQFVLLFPCLARYLLQLRYLAFQHLVLSSYCLMMAGMRSNALRKFTAAAWVSAIARWPLLYLYL